LSAFKNKMIIKETELKEVYEIDLEPQADQRGFFMRTYDDEVFARHGLHTGWVQENHSYSKRRGTVRGLHFQFPPHAETKLVRAVSGQVYMAFVDLRKGSPALGQWGSLTLSRDNNKMLYVPEGFALGMCTLTDGSALLYKMARHYAPESSGAIKWNDPDLGINWPLEGEPVISVRDAGAMSFKEFMAKHGGL